MNFIAKKLLGGLLLTGIVPATLLLTSCSTNDEQPFDMGISESTKDYYGEKIATKASEAPEKVDRKTILITAAGRVNDKSFNQSVWEAMSLYKEQAEITDKKTITFRQTEEDNQLPYMYDLALNEGYKTWVLTGFQQETLFKSWLARSGNQDKFIASKAVVVGVDWNGSSFIPKGQFFGLGFKSQEASWVVGYAASQYLSTTDKPYLSSFGGGIFDGVTDFNNGFLQGMLDWNTANPDKKVKFHSGNKQANSINLSTGFLVNPEAMQTVESIVGIGADVPQIIMPVAGTLTTTTIDNINDKRSSQMVIGVDTNQSLAFPNDKGKFFSSVEKKVAVGVYKALILLADIPLDFKEGTTVDDAGFESTFVEYQTNAYVEYGFDKGLVGYSPSTLSNSDDAAQVNIFLDEAYEKFSTSTPQFISMIDGNNNQKLLNALVVKINL